MNAMLEGVTVTGRDGKVRAPAATAYCEPKPPWNPCEPLSKLLRGGLFRGNM